MEIRRDFVSRTLARSVRRMPFDRERANVSSIKKRAALPLAEEPRTQVWPPKSLGSIKKCSHRAPDDARQLQCDRLDLPARSLPAITRQRHSPQPFEAFAARTALERRLVYPGRTLFAISKHPKGKLTLSPPNEKLPKREGSSEKLPMRICLNESVLPGTKFASSLIRLYLSPFCLMCCLRTLPI